MAEKKKEKSEQRRVKAESKQSQSQIAIMSELAKKYDPTATMDDLIEDLRRVKAEHPYKYITRDFYRIHGKYSDRTWSNKVGTFNEFRKKAGLELHRGAQKLEKDIAKHSANDRYRGFNEIEIMPYAGKYEKKGELKGIKTILIGSDFHDKDADPFVLKVFLETAKRVQPDDIVLAGDIFDMYDFSYFAQDPRQLKLKESFDFVRDHIFKPLRKACPKSNIDLIWGNHEHRVLRLMADRTPNLKVLMDLMGISLSKLLMLDDYQINLICKSDLAAYTPTEVRDEMRKNYKIYYDALVVDHFGGEQFCMPTISGHTHKPKFLTKVNEKIGPTFWLTLGSIARADMEYVQGLNQYQNSFALVHIDTETKEVIPEHIYFTQNYAVVGGIFYKRS